MTRILAVMVTCTTYGSWLRGDRRGWVEDGGVLPPNPVVEAFDHTRMKHDRFQFSEDECFSVGTMIGQSLTERLSLSLLAMTVQSWHLHLIYVATGHSVEKVVKTLKDAVRWGLRPGRPVWTEGYDKRFCLDEDSVEARVRYVERHNEAVGLPSRPWPFLLPLSDVF